MESALLPGDCVAWLCAWFARKRELPAGIETANYFEAGLIDSFGVIELIEDLEREFAVRFRETHFQDRRFATIAGLGEIVCEIRRETA